MTQNCKDKNRIMDLAANIAIKAKRENMTSNAINNIIEAFNSVDPEIAIKLTIAFIARKGAQRILGRETTRAYISALNEILNCDGLEFHEKNRYAMLLLGTVKWMFESIKDKRVPFGREEFIDYNSFVKIFIGGVNKK